MLTDAQAAAVNRIRLPKRYAFQISGKTSQPAPDIHIELRRGATSVSVTWPLAAVDQCSVWMRELLKRSGWMRCGWPPSHWTC